MMTYEESYCSKKLEAAKAPSKPDIFSRVQHPQSSTPRQSLLMEDNGRIQYQDGYGKRYNDHSYHNNNEVARHDSSRYSDPRQVRREDRYGAVHRDGDRMLERYGGKSGPVRASTRYGHRYAPYEHKRPQLWREKHQLAADKHRNLANPPLMITDGISTNASVQARESDTETSTVRGLTSLSGKATQNSGKKLASAIVTPSRSQPKDQNVTTRDTNVAKQIPFSLMEEDNNEYQMIGALQGMDIAGSSSMVVDHDSFMMEKVEEDDLLGEDLKEMEEDLSAKETSVVPERYGSRSGRKPKSHSSRTGLRKTRPGPSFGSQAKKAVLMKRGSPRPRHRSPAHFPSYGESKGQMIIRKDKRNASSSKENGLRGSKQTPKNNP
ncbi:Uncharacterized protein Rs2_27931 [Raphanus sativus]|nr:Uncharacterized protein Rs2_27931 [Raphanus sativus]